jgi:hypothetical protein
MNRYHQRPVARVLSAGGSLVFDDDENYAQRNHDNTRRHRRVHRRAAAPTNFTALRRCTGQCAPFRKLRATIRPPAGREHDQERG